MLTLKFLELPITIAVISAVWINLLTPSGKLFDFAQYYFKKYVTTNKKVCTVLFECAACLSGQIALWYILICASVFNFVQYPVQTILYSIFFGALFSKLITRV